MGKDFVLATYVYLVANLPLQPDIIFESPAAIALMADERHSYQYRSLWLRNIVLAEPLLPKAYQEGGQYQQPYAELDAARLALTIAVHRSSENLALRQVPSPAELWFKWISEIAQQNFDDLGLIGQPVIVPKREHYKNVMQFCSLLEKRKAQPEDFTGISSTGRLILAEAQTLAERYPNFRYQHLRPFIKIWRRAAKQIKHCKQLQDSCLMFDGSIFITGKDRKLPPRM